MSFCKIKIGCFLFIQNSLRNFAKMHNYSNSYQWSLRHQRNQCYSFLYFHSCGFQLSLVFSTFVSKMANYTTKYSKFIFGFILAKVLREHYLQFFCSPPNQNILICFSWSTDFFMVIAQFYLNLYFQYLMEYPGGSRQLKLNKLFHSKNSNIQFGKYPCLRFLPSTHFLTFKLFSIFQFFALIYLLISL